MTTENFNLNELGLGDNAQSAINEKMPRRGAEGRGQSRESRKSLSEHDTARKPERVPMYAQRTMIDTTLIPEGYHGHWVSNNPAGRIDMLLRAGYDFVTKDQNVYSSHVTENGVDSRVSKSGSDGVTLYLMIIPLELYEADQEAKAEKAKEQTATIFGKQRNDPDFFSRDEFGRDTPASRGIGRVTTNDFVL